MIVNRKNNRGFSILETIIYFSILLVASAASITAFLAYSDILRELKARSLLSDTAQNTLERITREIRNADTVDPFNTTLDNADGELTLVNIDDPDVTFDLNAGAIDIAYAGGFTEALTPDEVSVDSFYVHRYVDETELVRVVFTLTATSSGRAISETFYGGAVLRGSYD